jgi:dsDNA-specific endonuclease/ATPase MutS2
LKNKVRKMVFIHGVGNGKLKYELIKALNERYPDLVYQDASFKEYGYGATMVYL